MKENFMQTIITTLTLCISLSFCGINFCLASGHSSPHDESPVGILDTNFVNLPDTVILQTSDCTANAQLCMDLPIDSISNYQLLADGMPYNLGFAPCDVDTIFRYLNFNLQTEGPYSLVFWEINGTNVAANNPFATKEDLVNLLNGFDPMGNWIYDAANGIYSGGVESSTYSDMVIFEVNLNTAQTLPKDEFYFANGTELNFPNGFTEFILRENSTGLADTFTVNVVCIQTDTINVNLLISDSSVECFDFSELPGELSSVLNVCPGSSGFATNSLFVNGDSCMVISSIAGGTDVFCILACDGLGICDTTIYIVNVNIPGSPGTHTYYDTLLVGESNVFCVNTAVFAGTPDTIYNICPTSTGQNVGLSLNQNTFCINYNGVSMGQDTACIVVCDDLGVCDTTMVFFTVQTLGADFYYDTVFLNITETFCNFDLSELPGNLTGIVNGCAGNTGGYVDFMVNSLNNCVSYEGLAAGKDTACIYLTDDLGNQDTLYMVICALEPTTEIIVDTIRLDLTVNYCLDASQLGGNMSDTVYFCDPLPSHVTLVPNAGSLCFDMTGDILATDTFCVYICDDLGICDTTIFQITVNDDEILLPPTALNDIDTTNQGTLMVTNVCNNDTLPQNSLTAFFVLAQDAGGIGPNNGVAFVNDDCTISYQPNEGFCDASDAYSYVICNSAGCDTAFVNVYVACVSEDLHIYTGFSPNNDPDGVNEFWKIQGIEAYPNNEVRVFNRWGNEVYRVKGYNNVDKAWRGEWQSIDLPDGTYYYIVDLGNEQGDRMTGWVLIRR